MPPQPKLRSLPRPLLIFLLVNLLATLTCVAVEVICKRFGYGQIYYKPWFVGVKFYDFDSFQDRFTHLHTAAFWDLTTIWPFAYPAPCAVVYAFFYRFGPAASLNVFLGFTVGSFLAVCSLFAWALYRRGLSAWPAVLFAGSAFLLAFPFWFGFQRGNIEIIVFLSLAAGVWAFRRGRGYSAAACFALAAAFKITPVLYFALFLIRRQYRQLAAAIGITALLTFASLWWVGPTVAQAYHGISAGVALFTQEFLLQPRRDSTGFDHSLFSIYRRFFSDPALTPLIYRVYTPLVALAGSLVYFLRIRRLPFANQLLLLSIAAIWLTPVSFEYTLMHLYLSIGVLALTALETAPQRPVKVMLVLLAVLVSPVSEFIVHGARFAGQVQSVLLGVLFVYALVRPVESTLASAPITGSV